jgi:uncharacterized protein YcnI
MKPTLRPGNGRPAFARSVKGAIVCAVTAGTVALVATPAWAHVTVTPTETAAGSYTVLTFSVPHGCDGAATTKVSIKIPQEILSVTPSVNPGWTPKKTMAKLSPPVKDAHGEEVTERVSEVVYTAKTPLADDLRDKFELSLQLPKTPGKTLAFPSVQTCEKGETAWVQVPAAGQKADDLEHPAPSFVVTAAEEEGAAANADPAANGNAAVANARTTSAGSAADDDSNTLSWISLGVGGLGLIVGAVALFRPRLSRSRPTT